MIKECPVLLNNSYCTVVKYGNIEVQMPAIHRNADFLFVDYSDGKYTIVEKNEVREEVKVVNEEPQEVNETTPKAKSRKRKKPIKE